MRIMEKQDIINLALLGALALDDHAAVREMVSTGANVNFASSDGRTPLHLAAVSGSDALVRVLLELGANVNAVNRDKETPLHLAARFSNSGVFGPLIHAGADVEAEDRYDRTPEYSASKSTKPAGTRQAFQRALATRHGAVPQR
jgi:ankyrin repeat protein